MACSEEYSSEMFNEGDDATNDDDMLNRKNTKKRDPYAFGLGK